MELAVRFKMNEKLYLRNPEDSDTGRNIVKKGLQMINKLGFEDFTFKKLALELKTSEASIYRYFENKHRLLIYLITWYWSLLEYKVVFSINNLTNPELKLKTIIKLLVVEPEKKNTEKEYISEWQVCQLVKWEASKTYLTRRVTKDNKNRLFKPYKDLATRIAFVIKEMKPDYQFANSLASTLLEMSHAQKFFMENLPALTDKKIGRDEDIIAFLEELAFSALKSNR